MPSMVAEYILSVLSISIVGVAVAKVDHTVHPMEMHQRCRSFILNSVRNKSTVLQYLLRRVKTNYALFIISSKIPMEKVTLEFKKCRFSKNNSLHVSELSDQSFIIASSNP
jgi:hypothetical protein